MSRKLQQMRARLFAGVVALSSWSPVLSGCGGAASSAPAVTVSESNYQERSSAPKPKIASPHSLQAPPAPTSGEASQDAAWWTEDPPCPPGATLYGGPPPEHSEVGCKTDKGVNEGHYTRFHPNGKKAEEGQYEKHFAVGTWVKWNESGVKVSETPYDKGAQEGIETEWFPDGKIKSQRTYSHGKRDGLTTLWDAEGNKRSAIEYRAGVQSGPATYWDETGTVARVEQWNNGKRVK